MLMTHHHTVKEMLFSASDATQRHSKERCNPTPYVLHTKAVKITLMMVKLNYLTKNTYPNRILSVCVNSNQYTLTQGIKFSSVAVTSVLAADGCCYRLVMFYHLMYPK